MVKRGINKLEKKVFYYDNIKRIMIINKIPNNFKQQIFLL